MASPSRSEREEERRLNMRTLTIASAASAAAAAVTSQLWIAGTWIAAAATPVIVALVSEALHRPTEKLARAWTSEGPALGMGERGAKAAGRDHEPPLAEASGPAPPPPPDADRLPRRAPSDAAPVRVYRQPATSAGRSRGGGRRPGEGGRRRIAFGIVAATAAIAFVIALVTITAGELIAGGSLAGGDRKTTFAGGGKRSADERSSDQKEQPGQNEPGATTDEQSEDAPAEETAPEETTPTAPPEEAPTEQAPSVEETPGQTPTVP